MKKRKQTSTSIGRGSYTVGNGKPPVEHQFKPSQSGNPRVAPRARRTSRVLSERRPAERSAWDTAPAAAKC
jgi:hypothetical protein